MPQFDTIIRGGTIVDGTRVPRYRADLGIKDGKIAKIGRLHPSDATKVIDANGLIVAPGFIDLHTHYDAQLHWDPYCSIGSWHGVTSVTIGNCGFGFAPLRPQDADRAMLALSRTEAIPLEPMRVSMKVDWETFPQYLDRLSRMPLGINISHLFPIAPAVAYVMGGFDAAKKRFPNEKEMATIIRLYHEAVDAGAAGWSAQRLVPESRVSVQRDYDGTPMITDILPDEFYLTMAKAMADKGDGCIQFTQSGASETTFGIEDDFRFLEKMAETSGRPLLYNAILISDRHPESHKQQLNWVEQANARGVRVFGQAVTARAPVRMTLEDWNLFDSIPAWKDATLGTIEERKAKMSRPELRAAMRADYDAGGMETLNIVFGEFDKFIARKVRNPELKLKYEGLSVAQIAKMENKHVIDAMLDLSVADDLRTEWAGPVENANVAGYKDLMSSPYIMPGVSDGGAHVKFITPAIYPTEVLSWLVRDTGVLTLEEAHFRLSGLMAWAAGFKDRGTLREGQAADIVIYDLNTVQALPSEIAYDLPANEWRRVQRAEGYKHILVNGVETFQDGKCTGATPGALLRNGAAR
ncbi:MAG TPA: amidohydrolase family protein [Methylomirabilota bacterium]|jgi:N-acyl-D-aspartate/D-glutamate deacylase|nr:amidohydrolase family protein [Methylomirabilota bacterium]